MTAYPEGENTVIEPIRVIYWRPELRGGRASVHHLSDEKSMIVDNNVVIEHMANVFKVSEHKFRVSFVDGYKLISFCGIIEKKKYEGWKQVSDWRKEAWAKL